MRRQFQILRLLLVPGLLLLCVSCSAVPRKTTLHYSPPSTAAIHKPLATARTSAGEAKAAVAHARELAPVEIPDLRDALDFASGKIDILTAQLLTADRALDEYEKKVVAQTNAANAAIDQKNHAIDVANDAVSRYHKLKFSVCLLAAAAALLLVFQFRGLFLFIPPPYNFAILAAVPIATFGFLWLRL